MADDSERSIKIYLREVRQTLQMSEELGREPTYEELAEEIGISSAKLLS